MDIWPVPGTCRGAATERRGERMLKKSRPLAALALIVLCGALAGAQTASAPERQPVDVRVHVAAGGRFIDDLSLADFGLVEDGRPQPLRSLTLIRSGQIVRRQGIDVMVTPPPRDYTMLFQLTHCDPDLSKTVEDLFFFSRRPSDTMTFIS